MKSEEILKQDGWIQTKGQRLKKKILLTEKDLDQEGTLLQINVVGPKTNMEPHFHKKMTESVYILSGEAIIYIDGKDYDMKTGDLIIIDPNKTHGVKNHLDEEFKYLVLKTNFSQEDKFEKNF